MRPVFLAFFHGVTEMIENISPKEYNIIMWFMGCLVVNYGEK